MAHVIHKKALKSKWTQKEYFKHLNELDNDKHYEIINGELLEMPTPRPKHQIISDNIVFLLNLYVREKKLGRVLTAPLEVILSENQKPQPDILFIFKENLGIIQEKGIFGVPDLIIEIISPFNKKHDTQTKYEIYESHKVKEYWIIDDSDKSINIFSLNPSGKFEKYMGIEKEGKITSKILDGFEIDLNEIFF